MGGARLFLGVPTNHHGRVGNPLFNRDQIPICLFEGKSSVSAHIDRNAQSCSQASFIFLTDGEKARVPRFWHKGQTAVIMICDSGQKQILLFSKLGCVVLYTNGKLSSC